MEKLQRGDKIYLDSENKLESNVNGYLDCRDGIVECFEYINDSGYGSKERIFICRDTKHESVALIRQTYDEYSKYWNEQTLYFDSDTFEYMEALITGKHDIIGGKYTLVRDY